MKWLTFILWIMDILCLTVITVFCAQHLESIMPQSATIPIVIVATLFYLFFLSIVTLLAVDCNHWHASNPRIHWRNHARNKH